VNLRISLPFRELIALYWEIGKDILTRQAEQGWGVKVIGGLLRDLWAAFPEMKGFSSANLLYMRAFAQAWSGPAIIQQAVGQLPWGHNIGLLTRLKSPEWRLAYAHQVIEQKSDRFKPEQLRMNLPSIERIEAELAGETLPNEDDKEDGS
jgi:predicted nuclease of restriction endonuclease-like (RecB) superfamily